MIQSDDIKRWLIYLPNTGVEQREGVISIDLYTARSREYSHPAGAVCPKADLIEKPVHLVVDDQDDDCVAVLDMTAEQFFKLQKLINEVTSFMACNTHKETTHE